MLDYLRIGQREVEIVYKFDHSKYIWSICKPFYNSFISTFCYQLINEKPPVIDEDRKVKLIYVGSVVEKIYNIIKNDENLKKIFNYKDIEIEYDKKKYVSEVLSILKKFDNQYKKTNIIPNISSNFKLSLFNTHRSYLPTEYFPKKHIQNIDYRESSLS